MAHFAQIDENNIVINVLSVPDEEQNRGQEYLNENLGLGGRWIQTSYNNRVRKNFAGIGYTYNEELDIFLPTSPFPSWKINPSLGAWEAPIERPEEINGSALIWDEENQLWRRENLPLI